MSNMNMARSLIDACESQVPYRFRVLRFLVGLVISFLDFGSILINRDSWEMTTVIDCNPSGKSTHELYLDRYTASNRMERCDTRKHRNKRRHLLVTVTTK